MILPRTKIISRQYEESLNSGIDCYEHCINKHHYVNYPHTVTYSYNSRGFRDQEWPNRLVDLKKSIWCVGDSFTSGIGMPYHHTWPQVLSKRTGQRTINVSLDGASNNWIGRQAKMILDEITPEIIIVHWSFSHRREKNIDEVLNSIWHNYYNAIKDPDWPDCTSHSNMNFLPIEVQTAINNDPKSSTWADVCDVDSDCRLFSVDSSAEENFNNTQLCIDQIKHNRDTKIIHSFIPKWHPTTCELNVNKQLVIPEFQRLDYARDGFHYGIKTSEYFVNQIISLI